jgi:hypothetical protein
VIQGGRPIFIELKTAKGVMSRRGVRWDGSSPICGADVVGVRSVEGGVCAAELGVPLRGTVSA